MTSKSYTNNFLSNNLGCISGFLLGKVNATSEWHYNY